jgi:hypothetical protein
MTDEKLDRSAEDDDTSTAEGDLELTAEGDLELPDEEAESVKGGMTKHEHVSDSAPRSTK